MSEPTLPDAATAFARSLVDEWVRAGVTEACVAPGSRSTPLALALASDGRLRVHVHLDERSASFFALGAAKASGRPVVVLCTSGTAAANFHPAVLEAHHARVPLLVCTADRPPELRDTGAGQTIDQTRLFGDAVRWFVDPGPPDAAAAGSWRSIASRSRRSGGAARRTGAPQPPVSRTAGADGRSDGRRAGRPDGAPWTRGAIAEGARRRDGCPRRRGDCRHATRRAGRRVGFGGDAGDDGARRGRRRVAGARRPAVGRARRAPRHLDVRRDAAGRRCRSVAASGRRRSPRRAAHQQGRRASGSVTASTRSWSTPTARGSTPRVPSTR